MSMRFYESILHMNGDIGKDRALPAPSLNSKSMATLGHFENPRTVGHIDMVKSRENPCLLGRI